MLHELCLRTTGSDATLKAKISHLLSRQLAPVPVPAFIGSPTPRQARAAGQCVAGRLPFPKRLSPGKNEPPLQPWPCIVAPGTFLGARGLCEQLLLLALWKQMMV